MKKSLFVVLVLMLVGFAMMPGRASSHREAPLISDDPTADNTDVYAFISPDRPDSVTLISNWIPFENPQGGPNFWSFDPSVRYDIKVDNTGDGREDLIFRFEFNRSYTNPNTFLYNTGLVTSIDDPDLNFRQQGVVTIIRNGTAIARIGPFLTGPSHVGVTTPVAESFPGIQLAQLPEGLVRIFAGQVDDPFFLDLRVFDGLYGTNLSEVGTDSLAGYNVHTTAIQVPKSLFRGGTPIGAVWSTADRRATTVRTPGGQTTSGDFIQVSRLGMPLVNEVVIPVRLKDTFNASVPTGDGQFLSLVQNPELATLLNVFYKIPVAATPRADLVQIFLTGVKNINEYPGGTPYEALRLNTDTLPSGNPSPLGVFGGDLQGFPNGRRLADDIIDIELQAVAGELVGNPNDLGDGVNKNDIRFNASFPYLARPHSGARPWKLNPVLPQ